MRAELSLLFERERLTLADLGEVVAAHDPDALDPAPERWAATLAALPSGLADAESVWLTRGEPIGAAPLDPEGLWFAIDRALVRVVSPRRAALVEAMRRLGEYALLARLVSTRAAQIPGLATALAAVAGTMSPVHPVDRARVALALGLDDAQLAALEREVPELPRELARLARGAPNIDVFVHGSVQPSRGRRVGASIGARLLEALPPGPTRLVVADDARAIDAVSPYLREAAPELLSAAIARGGPLGAVLARREGRGATVELASVAFAGLRRAHPVLAEERRAAERAGGLLVGEESDVAFGVFDAALVLREVDPRGASARERPPLTFVAGPVDGALLSAVEVLVGTGRVEQLAIVLGSPELTDGVVALPELVVADDDAFALEVGERAHKRAEALVRASGVARLPRASVDERVGAPEVLTELLRRARRAAAIHGLAPPHVVLYASRALPDRTSLEHALAPVWAGRLALAHLASSDPSAVTRTDTERADRGRSLRFRA
jgi:hypothetical protein